LQATFIEEETEVEIADGCVMVTDTVAVPEAASETVQVYVPATRPLATEDDPPDGAHEYV